MDQTGAFTLVFALQNDWDSHPKNIIPATAAVGLIAATPASIRQRPFFAMPALYTRVATVYDREMYKLEKERFEKLDEAETTLHAAIVESLSPGTVRTINTATPAGIASLSAVQLVGQVHTLFSTPTLQDIITVNADLLRPLQNFEDFPDHITEHINHYESLASFNQPCANISKIQTFQTAIQRWPQLDSTCLPATPTCRKTSSLAVATHTLPEKARANKTKAKAATKDAEKAKAKIKAKAAHSLTTNISSNLLSTHASTSAKLKPSKSPNYQMTARILWIQTIDLNPTTNPDNLPHPIARSYACTAQTPPIRPRPVTPTPIRQSTTTARTTALT